MQWIGDYRVLGEVGRGGMGAVFRAIEPGGRQVALKLLLSGASASTRSRRRVETEARAIQRVRHPHVVELLAHGEHAGVPYLVMEWIQGETLAARLMRAGQLRPREAATLCAALAGALERCHAEGVLHRDLKPDNVLLREDRAPPGLEEVGHPLLTDFGLAKDLAGEEGRTSVRTREGSLLGTPHWAPPEQLRGEVERVGPRSDVYGLGAILYGALTARAPREGDSAVELVAAAERDPDPPSVRVRGIPPELDQLALRCLALRIEDRPASAGEVGEALRAWLDGRASTGAASGVSRGARSRAVPALAACLAVAAAVLAIASRTSPRGPAVTTTATPSTLAAPEHHSPEAQRAVELAERAWALWQLGEDLAGAARLSDEALALDPRCDRAILLRGCVAGDRGDTALALQLVGEAIDLSPRDARGWVVRSELRSSTSDFTGAEADAARAIELAPEKASPWAARATARSALGRADEALLDVDRALAVAPAEPKLRFIRANIRMVLEDLQGTIEDASAGLEAGPNVGLYGFRAYARAALGDLEGGERDADSALRLAPDDPYSLSVRADIRRWRGDLLGAGEDAERAARRAPDQHYPRVARAEVRLARGDVQGALEDAQQAVARFPSDPYVHITLSNACRAANDPGRALECARRALQLSSRSSRARLAGAQALIALGGDGAERGRGELEALLELAPPSSPLAAEVRRALGR